MLHLLDRIQIQIKELEIQLHQLRGSSLYIVFSASEIKLEGVLVFVNFQAQIHIPSTPKKYIYKYKFYTDSAFAVIETYTEEASFKNPAKGQLDKCLFNN